MTHPLARVVVVGTSGCGKSTFARQLAAILHVRYLEMDGLFWLPGWRQRDPAEFHNLVEKVVETEQWVIDGNYGAVRTMIWTRATHIIWLNYSYPRVVWQVTRRTVANIVHKREVFPGCRETFRNAFLSRESVIWWSISTYHRRRERYQVMMAGQGFDHLQWIEMRHPRDTERFIASLR
jgi:adenylate kinase family enzyme